MTKKLFEFQGRSDRQFVDHLTSFTKYGFIKKYCLTVLKRTISLKWKHHEANKISQKIHEPSNIVRLSLELLFNPRYWYFCLTHGSGTLV